MVKVAREWAATPDVLFLFVGEGKVKEKFNPRQGALQHQVGFPTKGITGRHRRDDPAPWLRGTSVPSKVFGYMAVEVPVLSNCDLDLARMIQETQCGIVGSSRRCGGDFRSLTAHDRES